MIGLAVLFLTLAAAAADSEWVVWPNSPPAGLPLPLSTDLTGFSYLSGVGAGGGMAVPARIGADTWYPSWAADGRLFSSFTDGTVAGVSSGSGGSGATTG